MNFRLKIFISALSLLLLTSCLNLAGDCETEIRERTCNSSQTFEIVKTSTDCGATTTPSTSIRLSIGCGNSEPPDKKNIIYGSEYHYEYSWLDDYTISVKTSDSTGYDVRKDRLDLDGIEQPVTVIFD